MKIAICSDSHDNLVNITKFLFYCENNGVEIIIHCGDWRAPSLLNFFRKNFTGKIYGVYGNVHGEEQLIIKKAKKLRIKIQAEELSFTLDKIKMMITHYPEKAERLALSGKYQIIWYGHNHKPWKKKVGRIYLINPGTLAGMFYRASFALYNTKTKKLELKLLDQI